MAANLKGRGITGGFGKRVANQIWPAKSKDLVLPAALSAPAFRGVAGYTSSAYDKNIEEGDRPAIVPDYAIASDSDKYWGPHPKTGVFGPADPNVGSDVRLRSIPASGDGTSASVLDQTAWFRPLEDVQKPPPLS